MAATSNNAKPLFVETEPSLEDIRLLESNLYDFNVRTTGITDGDFLSIFMRAEDGSAQGGVFGWTWGGTCYVRYLFVPENMRGRGHGRRLMDAVQVEAKARKCGQIVLETHDFQAPGFYKKLGFDVVGRVSDYPRGHQYLTLVKRLY